MTRLTPYIHFNGNCREAVTFYRDCLGGDLWVQTVGETPMAQGMPAEMHGRVLHAEVTAGDLKVMASDMMDESTAASGGPVTLCINGGSKDELQGYFDKLAAGGTVNHPLKEEFFGTFGDLTDKYGVSWMFQAGGQNS